MYKDVCLTVVLLGCLAGCGGGSSSSSGAVAPALLTGVLGDPVVEGLRFETPTQSGVTSSTGEFSYQNGETVRFYLDDLLIGSVPGAEALGIREINEPDVPGSAAELLVYEETHPARSLLRRGLNVVSVLLTLDVDADASNGIQIEAAVARRFAGKEIDLGAPSGLASSRRMREFLYEAQAAGELTARPLHSRALAAAMLFEFDVSSYRAYERTRNGVREFASLREFNDAGRTTRTDVDSNGDGAFNLRTEHDWNPNLSNTAFRLDSDLDGTFDQVTEYVFDAFGSEVLRTSYDGDRDETFRREQTWNDVGALVLRRSIFPASEKSERWLYVDGVRDTYELDADGDGTFDRRDVFTFDERGNWLTRERDDGIDGGVDARYERDFNERDQLLRSAEDHDADGAFDMVRTWMYNEDGSVLEDVIEIDGALATRIAYEYDDAGLLMLTRTDANGDGSWNRTLEYQRNSVGRIEVSLVDLDGDGSVDSRTEQIYDDLGQRVETLVDRNGDGVTDEQRLQTYEDGRLVLRQTDAENDGTFEVEERYFDFAEVPASTLF